MLTFNLTCHLALTWRESAAISRTNLDGVVKSLKMRFSVIPAKAGIQFFQILLNSLDSGFHRSDDFLRDYQF